jgi:hypothetical protein
VANDGIDVVELRTMCRRVVAVRLATFMERSGRAGGRVSLYE